MPLLTNMKDKSRGKLLHWCNMIRSEGYTKRHKVMDAITLSLSIATMIALVCSYGFVSGILLSVLTTILFVACEWTLEMVYLSSRVTYSQPYVMNLEDDKLSNDFNPFEHSESDIDLNEMLSEKRNKESE